MRSEHAELLRVRERLGRMRGRSPRGLERARRVARGMPVIGDRLGRGTFGCQRWVGLQDLRHAGMPALAFARQLASLDRLLDERVMELEEVAIGGE
jgi:hypothetical protein